eukprot:7238612-Pyramimonas_sp.AAC.1
MAIPAYACVHGRCAKNAARIHNAQNNAPCDSHRGQSNATVQQGHILRGWRVFGIGDHCGHPGSGHGTTVGTLAAGT